MSRIIGIVGLAGAGKNTVADILIDKYGYTLDSFAAPVKDATANVFGWDRALLEGDTKESRKFRETTCLFWSEKLGYKFTPRMAMQKVGTDLFRDNLDPDVWINSFLKRNSDPNKKIVVADVRFSNEIKIIKSLGGKIVRVKRGEDPEWLTRVIDHAVEYSSPDHGDFSDYIEYQEGLGKEVLGMNYRALDLPHVSEWAWVESINYVHNQIDNSGTLQDLEDNVIDFIDPKGSLLMKDITTESV